MIQTLDKLLHRMGRRAMERQLDAIGQAVADGDQHRLAVAVCCAYAAGASADQVQGAVRVVCRRFNVPAFVQVVAFEVAHACAARPQRRATA
jgi:hypothetical protein